MSFCPLFTESKLCTGHLQYVKGFRIPSNSGLHFPAFGYSVRIQENIDHNNSENGNSSRSFYKRACSWLPFSFIEPFHTALKQLLWESLTENFHRHLEQFTYNLLIAFLSFFLLMEDYVQSPLQKELCITFFVESFKTNYLRKCS